MGTLGQKTIFRLLLATSTVFFLAFASIFFRYGVDLPVLDMWDFLQPMFQGAGFPDIFMTRYAMVRPGLGQVLTAVLYRLTDWNIRAEMIMIVCMVFANTLLALWLKKRLFGQWHLSDIAIIFVVSNFGQYETILFPTSSHSILPLTLGLLTGHALLARNAWLKVPACLVLGFLMLFTGFGIFLFFGLVATWIATLALSAMHKERGPATVLHIAALTASAAFLLLFLKGYVPETATGEPFGTLSSFKNYTLFLGSLSSGVFRLPSKVFPDFSVPVNLLFGFVFLTISFFFLVRWMLQALPATLKSREPMPPMHLLAVFFLCSTALYIFFTCVGRAPSGWHLGASPRYYILQAPLYLVIYFLLLSQGRKRWLAAFSVLFGISVLLNGVAAFRVAKSEHHRRVAWVAAMKETGSLEMAEQAAPGTIYPGGGVNHPGVNKGIDFLKANHLSLFRQGNTGR